MGSLPLASGILGRLQKVSRQGRAAQIRGNAAILCSREDSIYPPRILWV